MNSIQDPIPTKASVEWQQRIALNLEALKTAIHNPTLKNMCTLQSKLATKNKSDVERPVKNMATDMKMAKAVNKRGKVQAKKNKIL